MLFVFSYKLEEKNMARFCINLANISGYIVTILCSLLNCVVCIEMCPNYAFCAFKLGRKLPNSLKNDREVGALEDKINISLSARRCHSPCWRCLEGPRI